MNKHVLNKLEWHKIQDRLAEFCQSKQAKISAQELLPTLTSAEILANWRDVCHLKALCQQGERAAIGDLDNLPEMFTAVNKGRILTSLELRSIFRLLESVMGVQSFSKAHSTICPPLLQVKEALRPLPHLVKKIAQAVHPDGTISDQASPALHHIITQKQKIRASVEGQLQQLLSTQDWTQYLQDDFFTLRSDRYVLPIKIDGRGRVAGSIIDTSDSGQTLYVEPTIIRDLNLSLQDLELSKKLEIIRIFTELTQLVRNDLPALEANYLELIRLDFLSAQAEFGLQIGGEAIHLADAPLIDLRVARHPLLLSSSPATKHSSVVANTIYLSKEQPVMIISGPNAGGKTVVLKTVSMLLCMMKAGLLLPADRESRLFNFRTIYLNLGDAQNLSTDLSTFSGHLTELKPIFSDASTIDLVCLDEIAVGTEPQTGAAIAQAILEFIANKGILSLVTTHFEGLKTLALQNTLFRNAAMEYGLNTMHPTYRLAMDIPGQSYGLEVARQVGLPAALIARAKELRGSKVGELEQVFADLLAERQKLAEARQSIEAETAKAATAQAHWVKERELLQETRTQLAKKLNAKYAQEMEKHKEEYEALLASLRKSETPTPEVRKGLTTSLQGMKQSLSQLGQQFGVKEEVPGSAVSFDQLQPGDSVYVIALGKSAIVRKAVKAAHEKIEVAIGVVKFFVTAENLRKLSGDAARRAQQQEKSRPAPLVPKERAQKVKEEQEPITPYSTLPINTLNLRGVEVAPALDLMWKFLDAAMMRGENSVAIIHGHGSGSLKHALREALAANKDYGLSFKPGTEEEGGDSVTLVSFAE